MKHSFKKISITLIVLMLLSVSYSAKALDNSYLVEEEETSIELEDWMVDPMVWELQEDVKKGTPMLAITPDGDTVKVYIDDIVKAKDTIHQHNTYNTYNTYNNYDGWRFFYEDAWMLSSVWYHNYYHIYYPIVHRHIYHDYNSITKYYKKHNVVFVKEKQRKPTYYRIEKRSPYRSKYNQRYENPRHYNGNKSFERRSTSTYKSTPMQRPNNAQRPNVQRQVPKQNFNQPQHRSTRPSSNRR